ncbi:hypothetical protein Tco_0789132 [Tanacetum coccineum]
MMTSDLHGVERRSVTESWITVETVTGTCDDRKLFGYCDEEIWKNLEGDTCPCFVSNTFDEGWSMIIIRKTRSKKMRMIVPCDVCAMDSGGFAWRLDVVSALSLGPIY